MTKERAIDLCRAIDQYLCAGNPIWDTAEIQDAMSMAIKALNLKTGTYIDSETGRLKCSVCGKEFPFVNNVKFQGAVIWETDVLQHMNYCMNCVCKLEGDKQ